MSLKMQHSILAIAALMVWSTSVPAGAWSVSYAPPTPPTLTSTDSGPCNLCVNFTLVPPDSLYDFPPYRFTYDSPEGIAECAAYYKGFANASIDMPYNELVEQGLAAPLLTTFTDGPFTCSPTSIQFCASFPSSQDALTFEPKLTELLDRVSNEFDTFVCPTTTGGYAFEVSTSPADACLSINRRKACQVAPDPFPGCRCNKTRGITPLYVKPVVSQEPGRTNKTTLYCFTVDLLPEEARVESECGDVSSLAKAEIWASNALRSYVRDLRVTPNGGSPKWIKPSWGGAPVRDSLKATPLNWNLDQAVGGQICIDVASDVPLSDICMGGTCFVSLFGDQRICCPAYGASTSIF